MRIGEDDELQVKSPCNMLGYWNNHAATAEMIDSGRLAAHRRPGPHREGRIYITGRIKDILVLSNGEKVPPADMEMAIGLDPLFEQVMVVGEGRSFPQRLLVLNADLWTGLAREYGLNPERTESLADPRLIKDMLVASARPCETFPAMPRSAA